MVAPNRDNKPKIARTQQYVQNSSFDEEFDVLAVMPLGYDGQAAQRPLADSLNLKWETTGNTVYIGLAAPGTATSATTWQLQKIDTSTGTITFADGNANFDNEWDERASYTYS